MFVSLFFTSPLVASEAPINVADKEGSKGVPKLVSFSGAITPFLSASLSTSDEPLVPKSGFPKGIIKASLDLPKLIWIDLERGSLHVLEQSRPDWFEETKEIPISIGKLGYEKLHEGDLKTPVGVYHVTSYIDDEDLAAKYGNGAFPINYPNGYDRLRNRTGSGIWLHGLPKGMSSRPKLASDGCVVIDNVRFDVLSEEIVTGETIMVLGGELVLEPTRQDQNQSVLDAIDAWHKDWQAIDTPAYLSHYDETFTDGKRDLSQWKRYKKRVNDNKDWIKVGIEKISVLTYPNEDDLVTMRFHQVYKSNNYQWRGWKQLLWRKGADNRWRIIFEGNG